MGGLGRDEGEGGRGKAGARRWVSLSRLAAGDFVVWDAVLAHPRVQPQHLPRQRGRQGVKQWSNSGQAVVMQRRPDGGAKPATRAHPGLGLPP